MLQWAVDANGVLQTRDVGSAMPGTETFHDGFATDDGKILICEWPASGEVYYRAGFAFRGDGALVCVEAEPDAYIAGIGVSARGEMCITSSAATHVYAGLGMSDTGVVSVSEALGVAFLFASGEEGVWYDPSDLDTLFQDSAGTTPVTAVEQPVGLILDKSKGLTLGSELVTNGGPFTDATGWSPSAAGTTVEAVGGKLRVSAASIGAGAQQTLTVSAGSWIKIVVSGVDNVSGNAWDIGVAGTFYPSTAVSTAANGGVSFYHYVSADNPLLILRTRASASAVVDFGSVTVKALPGNHATQGTTSSKPTLRARYNLFTYSEQFDNTKWTEFSGSTAAATANAGTAPDGTETADFFHESSSTEIQALNQSLTAVVGGTYTLSFYAKYASRNIQVTFGTNDVTGNPRANFDVQNGALGTVDAAITASISSVGGGWYRCSASFVVAQSALDCSLAIITSTTDSRRPSIAGDGTSGLYIWGAQLVPGSVPGTYQRIAAATDYDSDASKFPYYLDFDGGDSLVTSAINLTATDKFDAFFGATTDALAAPQNIFNFGTDYNTLGGLEVVAETSGAMLSTCGDGSANFGVRSATVVFSAGGTVVCSVMVNKGGGSILGSFRHRKNAAELTENSSGGTYSSGNFGNLVFRIGGRSAAAQLIDGRIYSLIVRGAASNDSEIANAESYVAGKTGVVI